MSKLEINRKIFDTAVEEADVQVILEPYTLIKCKDTLMIFDNRDLIKLVELNSQQLNVLKNLKHLL